jgi:hypothetical protein
MQESMICAEHNIGSEIILDALDGTPRWRGSCGNLFWYVWIRSLHRCKIGGVCVNHAIGSIIILDTFDGTPR